MKKTLLLMAATAMLFGACCCNDKQECAATDPADVVMQNILNRKSVRSYNGEAIPDSVMQNLLRAAMSAPTGMDHHFLPHRPLKKTLDKVAKVVIIALAFSGIV